VALTLAMRDSGDVCAGTCRPGDRQAFHRRRGRLRLARAGAGAGGLRGLCADDLGPRAGPYRRHARQARGDPGLKTDVSEARFREIVAEAGCAIVSATARIAPADKRLYAIRDVTATVESIDLITASILSKKLAAGLEALVLDVKVRLRRLHGDDGRGRALAEALVSHRQWRGLPDHGADHRHEPAAAPRRATRWR
jgi:thymidine phosphorylase